MAMQDRAIEDANREGEPARGEVRRLKARLRDQERALHFLRAREQALAHLAAAAPTSFFSFRLGRAGASDVGGSGLADQEKHPGFLRGKSARQLYRRALEEREHVATFVETEHGLEESQAWEVVLARVPEEEPPVFSGVARWATSPPSERQQGHDPLIEALPEAVLILGAEGAIRYANPAALRLAGVDRAEAIEGRPVWDFVLPEDQAHARERARLMRRGLAVDHVGQDVPACRRGRGRHRDRVRPDYVPR